MRVVGVEGMTVGEIEQAVAQGGRFVVFEYCISVIILSFKRGSDVRFIKPGESAIGRGLDCTATTVLLGWWGIPWGPIFSIMALCTNLGGGRDVTAEMMAALGAGDDAPVPGTASQTAPDGVGHRPHAATSTYAPEPAYAVLTDGGRLRCSACGHAGSPSRTTCKNCRTPLVKAAPTRSRPAAPLGIAAAATPTYAPGPAYAVLTDGGRLRCSACGHAGSPSRATCKNCRTPLVKAASSRSRPAASLGTAAGSPSTPLPSDQAVAPR